MIDVAAGWVLDVERGPGWLFVKLSAAPAGWWQAPPLAECVWAVLKQQFVYRVVLDCGEFGHFNSAVIAQLVMLRRRIEEHDGVMRVCHLSAASRAALRACGLAADFPDCADVDDTVIPARPRKPR